MKGMVFFTDLDETLLNSKKEISKKNIEVIQKFRDRGGVFSIATGRTLENTKPYLEGLETDIPVVLFNGAAIYDNRTESFIQTFPLEPEVVEKVLKGYQEALEKVDINLIVYDLDEKFSHRETPLTRRVFLGNVSFPEIKPLGEIKKLKILKFMFVGKEEELKWLIQEKLRGYNCFFTTKRSVELVADGISKWRGIQEVVKDLPQTSHIYTIGDSYNDFHMIREADTGIAMENAHRDVKVVADLVIGHTNDEDGVAEALRGIMDNKKEIKKHNNKDGSE